MLHTINISVMKGTAYVVYVGMNRSEYMGNEWGKCWSERVIGVGEV
jgi:hypothetical protein